jgi:hypothetical protein
MSNNGEHNQDFLRDLVIFFALFATLLGVTLTGFTLFAYALSAFL